MIKPINIDALSKWVGQIPGDVVEDMPQIAPMLAKLGYDPRGNPPNYGQPDAFVLEKMNELDQHRDDWQQREDKVKEDRKRLRQKIINSSAHDSTAEKSGSWSLIHSLFPLTSVEHDFFRPI